MSIRGCHGSIHNLIPPWLKIWTTSLENEVVYTDVKTNTIEIALIFIYTRTLGPPDRLSAHIAHLLPTLDALAQITPQQEPDPQRKTTLWDALLDVSILWFLILLAAAGGAGTFVA